MEDDEGEDEAEEEEGEEEEDEEHSGEAPCAIDDKSETGEEEAEASEASDASDHGASSDVKTVVVGDRPKASKASGTGAVTVHDSIEIDVGAPAIDVNALTADELTERFSIKELRDLCVKRGIANPPRKKVDCARLIAADAAA